MKALLSVITRARVVCLSAAEVLITVICFVRKVLVVQCWNLFEINILKFAL